MEFLKSILAYNHYTVIVVPSPPHKPVPAPATTTPEQTFPSADPPKEETFTVGVTDVMFNPTNAIFGRLLKAPGGHIKTLAYWQQKEDAIPPRLN